MKGLMTVVAASVALLVSAGMFYVVYWQNTTDADEGMPEAALAEGQGTAGNELATVKRAVETLAEEVAALRAAVTQAEAAEDEAGAATGPRLEELEQTVARLQSSFDGMMSMEAAAAERADLFIGEDGYEKADEFFEAGKFAIAADGYMKFVHAHPDHPDAQDILQKARQAYKKAGYDDLAIWVQEEMMRSFPESRRADLKALAAMEKEAERYDDAINHIAEAAASATNPEEKMWNRMYWAWYNHLRDGPEAGLAAYELVQQEIISAGLADHKSATKIQAKIDELRKQVEAASSGN